MLRKCWQSDSYFFNEKNGKEILLRRRNCDDKNNENEGNPNFNETIHLYALHSDSPYKTAHKALTSVKSNSKRKVKF